MRQYNKTRLSNSATKMHGRQNLRNPLSAYMDGITTSGLSSPSTGNIQGLESQGGAVRQPSKDWGKKVRYIEPNCNT